VPVGIISTGWGGTPIEAWMSRAALAAFPQKIAPGEECSGPACLESAAKAEAAIHEWEARLRREDRGLAEGWHKPEAWQEPDGAVRGEIALPGPFAAAGLANFCGVIWLYREFDADAALAAEDAKVWLGTIVDADTVYINGTEAGGTTYRYPPRKYRVPAGLLRQGKNSIIMRVTCASGDGGVTPGKPFRVFNGKSQRELAGNWRWRAGAQAAQPRPEAFFFQRQPMGPYNAMIAPVLKYPLKGVIWYQGESNDSCPQTYEALFKAMIRDWRAKNGRHDLPFLFVQLPVYGEPAANDLSSPWAALREAQKAALSLPDTGMAAALDLGEWNDLHPLNKKAVGSRLSLAAEKTVFKGRNTAPGPLHCGTEQRQGRLYLQFQNCGAGLRASGTPYLSVV
jgi:sialate O-acetylesterase